MTIQTPPGAYVKELHDKRTRNSKTFEMGKNKRRLIKSLSAVHYKAPSGKFHTIDTTIRPEGNNFVVDKTDFDLSILADQVGYSYSSKRGGNATVRLLELDGKPVTDLGLNIKPRLDGDKLWYDEVLPGLDIYIEVRPLQVRVWKIIKNKDAAHEFKWFVAEDNARKNFAVKDKTEGTDNYQGQRQKRQRGEYVVGEARKLEIIPERKDFDGHFTFKETVTKRTAKKDRKTRVKNWVKEIVYPLLVDQDIIENITLDTDDGFELRINPPPAAYWYDTNPVDYVGNYYATPYYYNFNGGVLFRTIPLPTDVTVTAAALKINVSGILLPPTAGLIYGDDVDDAPPFSPGDLPSAITKTIASVSLAGLAPGWNSLDVTPLVQEIHVRPGWLEDNDMRFGLLNTGLNNLFYFYDYAAGPALAAILEIDYWAPTPYVPPVIGPPSHHQSKQLTVLAQDPLYFDTRTFSASITGQIDGYGHEIRRQGGYYAASFNISGTVEEINEWFASGLGRHIEVYNPGLAKIWIGFVNKISLNQGQRQNSIGPLLDTANKILVRYSVLTDITDSGAMGGQEATDFTNNATSQTRNAIWEKEFSINGATVTQAQQLRDAYIIDPTIVDPSTSMDFNLTGSGTATASIDCLGYWHFFKAYHYSAAAGTEDLSTKIENILGADINGIFSTDYSKITENTSDEAAFASGKEKAMTVLKGLISKGDGSDNPYQAGIYSGQRLVYEQVPTEIEYQWRGNRGVTNLIDRQIDPWDVLPGRWIFDPGFLIGRHSPITAATLGVDPRAGLIEVVKFSAPGGLSLNGVKLSQVDQILAKRGIGSV